MQYSIFDQNQWLFPDILRTDGKKNAELTLLRGQSCAIQIQISDLEVGVPVHWSVKGIDGIDVKFYREMEVCVNRNTNNLQCSGLTTGNWNDISRYRVRQAPYRTYDPLIAVNDIATEKEKEVYCIIFVPDYNTQAGVKSGCLCLTVGLNIIEIPVTIDVCNKTLPKRTLNLSNWAGMHVIAFQHGLEYGSPAHLNMVRKYIQTMVNCHQNIFWISFNDLTAKRIDGKLYFDFSGVKRWAELALECGMETLEWAHIITRPSWEDPPFLIEDKTELGKKLECLSTAGRKYMTAFLEQFNTFLTENGWRDISIVHISDEPKERCATDFRILSGIFRKYLPGIKLIDAVEIYFIEDALDIYVPKNHYFQFNRNDFEALRDNRNELWFYTCNMPGGPFLNRFLDSPLLNTRLLHWGNYRYNLTGYLHWGYFHMRKDQNPFEETSGTDWLPAGDTHIVYPGPDGPLISLRWFQMKCGMEDYEILYALGKIDREKADAICRKALFTFDDYIKDPDEFVKIITELVCAYDEV